MMKYSILYNHKRLCFNNNIESTYIDWLLLKGFSNTYQKYKDNYQIKHDVFIFDISVFEVLYNIFCSNNSQIPELSKVYEHLKKKVLDERTRFYEAVYNQAYLTLNSNTPDYLEDFMFNCEEIISEENFLIADSKCLDFSSILIHDKAFFKSLEKNNRPYYAINNHAAKLAKIDVNSIEQCLIEKQSEIKLLLEEFKSFLLGFIESIQQNLEKEFNQFKFCYHHLFKDIQFFKNSKIHSLSKYKFVIGMNSEKNVGKRGKTDTFVPAGTCTYGEKIFINSSNIQYSRGILYIKHTLKNILYHEVGHALDFVYFNDKILKNENDLQRSSYNKTHLKICKKNYANFKIVSSKLPKKFKLWLAYFIMPTKTVHNKNLKLSSLENDFFNIFNDIKPKNQQVYKPYTSINTKVSYKNFTLDYSKPLIETWAESFAIVFDWLKNGFNEQDKLALQKGRSSRRTLIQLQSYSLVYMLNHVDWLLLNISYSIYLKRKRQILQYIKHIKNIPLYIHNRKKKTIKRQKFISHKQLIKSVSI